MLNHALQYAQSGWPVFPCGPRAKIPLPGTHGVKDATLDPDRISQLWGDRPDLNIAMACGEPSGLIVIDIDPRNEGHLHWQDLLDVYGEHEPTREALTGGGGRHVFFQHPDFRVRNGKLAQGVDIKSTGGYVILPPSIHPSGTPYAWDATKPDSIAAAPPWLLAMLAPKKAPTASTAPQRHAAVTGSLSRCMAYLAKIPDSVAGNNGHGRMFHAACECFRFGLDPGEARQALEWFNATKCQPAWSERELSHKLQSAQSHIAEAGEFGQRVKDDRPRINGHKKAPPQIQQQNALPQQQNALLDAVATTPEYDPSRADQDARDEWAEWGEVGDIPESTPSATPPPPPAPVGPLPNDGDPKLINLSTIHPVPMQWLWPGRIPLGKLTLIAGDPGLGKSFTTLDMVARVTTGAAWPDDEMPQEPGGCVLLNAEDDPADTVVPRLIAAGADLSRVNLISAVYDCVPNRDATERWLNLATDLRAVERAIENTPNCRLIVIDPISAYLGQTDSHSNTDVRGVLGPLTALAARIGVAVVAITHLRKGEGSALYRAIGSIGFIATARMAWAVTKDKTDPTGATRLVLPLKANVAPDTTGLSYRLVACGDTARVQWDDVAVSISADDAMSKTGHSAEDEDEQPRRNEAKDWLANHLKDGPRPAKETIQQAKQNGHSERTLRRAKAELEVDAATTEGPDGRHEWVWGFNVKPKVHLNGRHWDGPE